MEARREITKKQGLEYVRAGKKRKGEILDVVMAVTGWSRANARRQLTGAAKRRGVPRKIPRRRERKYSAAAVTVLARVWSLVGEPCGKYLAVVMEDSLEALERFDELGPVAALLTGEVRSELLSMSGATIDRYLRPVKAARYPKPPSPTKAGTMLRQDIPVRWTGTPMEQRPGFLEIDTVAHCGDNLAGDYLWTLTATDVFLGWTRTVCIRSRGHRLVLDAIKAIIEELPYPVTGIDFDNGGEFVNHQFVAWAAEENIPLTRARPYQHNDNAHVEQRNNDWVRRHAFRYRYEGPEEMVLLNELWELVNQRKNYLLPMKKAAGWNKRNSGRTRRVYDQPRTAYLRLLDTGILDPAAATELKGIHDSLNPAEITRQINQIQTKLITRVKLRAGTGTTRISRAI